MSREAMQMALDMLNEIADDVYCDQKLEGVITALRQALETEQEPVCAHGVKKTKCDFCQSKQEPVAWRWKERINSDFDSWVITSSEPPPYAIEQQPLYTSPPKRDLTCVCGAVWEDETMVHPPRKREWVGLTHPQIHELDWPDGVSFEDILLFVRAIEQALKEKNHD